MSRQGPTEKSKPGAQVSTRRYSGHLAATVYPGTLSVRIWLAQKDKMMARYSKTGRRQSGMRAAAMINNDYYVLTSRRGEHPERWSWEIKRKSKPLGVRLTADGFQSDSAAQFAGKRALADFLSDLAIEERRSCK